MASITTTLPSELRDRVFQFLQTDRPTISACRLVCRVFREESSPYLIPRVLFAKRLEILAATAEVLDHPYFREHVTELLYDASFFHPNLAMNWMEYCRGCELSPVDFCDVEVTAKSRRHSALWARVTAEPAQDEWNLHQGFRMGCHKSFPDYRQAYTAQCRLDSKGAGKRFLRSIFSKLPRLRSVLFGDWRHLARGRESYVECAGRLFGQVLPPTLPTAHDFSTEGNYWNRNAESPADTFTAAAFAELLDAMGENPDGRVTSLRIEPHPFQDHLAAQKDSPHDGRGAVFLHQKFWRLEEGRDCPSWSFMRRLRQLRLQYRPDARYAAQPTSLRRLLCESSNLTHLALVLDDATFEESESEPIILSEQTVPELHLPHLQNLELQGWEFRSGDFQDCLQRHRSTLRHLRLEECYADLDSETLAAWAGMNLFLDSVQLVNKQHLKSSFTFRDNVDVKYRDVAMFLLRTEHESLWLGGRRNFVGTIEPWKRLRARSGEPWWTIPRAD